MSDKELLEELRMYLGYMDLPLRKSLLNLGLHDAKELVNVHVEWRTSKDTVQNLLSLIDVIDERLDRENNGQH